MGPIMHTCTFCKLWHSQGKTCLDAAAERGETVLSCPTCNKMFRGEQKFVTANMKVHHQASHASFTEDKHFRVPGRGDDLEC